MAERAVNFNHNNATITSTGDSVVNVGGKEGALLIGDGSNIELLEESEKEGLLCVTKDPLKGYQLKASNKNGQWDVLGEPYDDSMDMIYVIIMSH